MKKIIASSILFSVIPLQFSLTISCNTGKNRDMYERLMMINGVKALLGLIDDNDSPKLQPFFNENYELVTRNAGKTDFHEKSFLDTIFLDKQNHAKDAFSLQFLTAFLKLKPDENQKFNLSNIVLKIDRVTYFKIDTKSVANSDKKIIVFTNGVVNFVFEDKTTATIIEGFNTPIKDAQIDIFNEMFNDKFENQEIKDENYNNFFNIDRDFSITGFEVEKTVADVKINLAQNSQLAKKLKNILKNLNIKLDNLIKFDIKLNREKSKIDSTISDEDLKTRLFKTGDFIDVKFILSIPNGDVDQLTNSTTDFSLLLTKGPL